MLKVLHRPLAFTRKWQTLCYVFTPISWTLFFSICFVCAVSFCFSDFLSIFICLSIYLYISKFPKIWSTSELFFKPWKIGKNCGDWKIFARKNFCSQASKFTARNFWAYCKPPDDVQRADDVLLDARKLHVQSLERSDWKSSYWCYSQLIAELQTLEDWTVPDNSENHPSNYETFQNTVQIDGQLLI